MGYKVNAGQVYVYQFMSLAILIGTFIVQNNLETDLFGHPYKNKDTGIAIIIEYNLLHASRVVTK